MRLFNKVAIIGTGLIGGSLGLAIKKNKLAREVVGVSQHKNSLKRALKMKAIDRGSLSLDIIKGADLLILATPVNKIIYFRKKIAKFVDKDCIVTDVGSTKQEIVVSLDNVFLNFVGGHPLAGSEKRGIANSNAGIFKGSLCILTPTGKTSRFGLAKIKKLWAKVGARIVFMSPKEHDRILSLTSHLPHVVAFSLINSVPLEALKLASGGLKDTTRVAASDALLWKDIFLSNKENVLKSINLFQDNLLKIKGAIRKGDEKSLINILNQAREKRGKLE